jgi:hypothetical protein
MARRKETRKRRARWERMRPRVLARMAAYREVRPSAGHRSAQYAAAQAPPLPFCRDCGELFERTGHMTCQYPGGAQ